MSESRTVRVVGRESELAILDEVIDAADAGCGKAVILTGDHGVGKTALCQAVVEARQSPCRVLTVNCPPVSTLTSGLAPLRAALRRASIDPPATSQCLERMDAGDPLRAIDEWVDEVTAGDTLVIVVDDLQWADASLRDVISFLLSSVQRRLAVLVPLVLTALPEGDPVFGWLADTTRMLGVSLLSISVLTRAGTESQLANLLGSRPHQSLVDDVHRFSGGNPYFTLLLAQDLSASDRHLPQRPPNDLTTAVMGRWHSCTVGTRAVLCLLAIAGVHQPVSVLRSVVGELGWTTDVNSSLAEGRTMGFLSVVDDRHWFQHPLQPMILERLVPPEDRRAWYAAFARSGDRALEAATVTLAVALAQARWHDRAGCPDQAYRWAMRAWALRGDGARPTELLPTLRRAIDLRGSFSGAAEPVDELWERVREIAADSGEFGRELEAVEALMGLADETAEPLRMSELIVRRVLLRASLASEFFSLEELRRAVALASARPASWQLALAEAELAHAGMWHDLAGAAEIAGRALARAREAGHPRALSFALTASSMAALHSGRSGEAQELAADGVTAAAAAGDWWAFVHAVMWESNALPEQGGWEDIDLLSRRRAELATLGGPLTYTLQIGAVEAEIRLELGDWRACQQLLREAIVTDPGPIADLRCRLALSRLAAYQLRPEEAVAHVDRARELMAGHDTFANLNFEVTWATALLAAGQPAEAYAVALGAIDSEGFPVDMAERLLPLAARALAEQAVAARDRDLDDGAALWALGNLRQKHPNVTDRAAPSARFWRERIAAMQRWYDAETARAQLDEREAQLWRETREHCAVGQLPWLDVYACLRACEALLSGPDGRAEGIRQLRAGHDRASNLGAVGLSAEFERLARLAHADLSGGAVALPVDHTRLGSLTPREREILQFLCRGLTYAEIAGELTISEKTVSSHVSNLLRKTGTSNRIQLTQLVERLR